MTQPPPQRRLAVRAPCPGVRLAQMAAHRLGALQPASHATADHAPRPEQHRVDGGATLTKPYAGGGHYINRQSTYCEGCRYDPRARSGPEACPVTALYWDFMARHADRFAGNRRMRQPLQTLARMDPDALAALRARAAAFRAELAG